ncbi:MAG: sodium:solute symporter family protein [Geminicoccaceae bacterium]|nr:cation acetate symporter [Geminicoccaceae bacterium]MCS7266489.1 cation acetate symporter [Geminicoccaceae bacterium]MDW8123915.1 sodium:solute symporter family protein [Geminicoccaceae bacterium]MDW8340022.1 sodium:solute symporter family protein [Geminicoccaceae bacterium]
MAQQTGQDVFVANLGKIYGYYTGVFLAFVVFLAILEQLGVPGYILGYAFVLLTIAVYAGIGILSRTAQVSEYYVAGRRVPAFYNGMATAADWMSAASFIGMAGSLYAQGYDGLAFILGWTGGYVLVAVLVAPYLRKFGAYTVPDFLAARYGGNLARFIGVIILVSCSFIYLMAQLTGTGLVAARLLGIPFEYGVFVGLVGILVCSMLGGMRAVTWTQVAQYIVLIIAYLIPVVILSTQKTGVPLPQLVYGQILQEITTLERTAAYIAPFVGEAKGHTTPFWFRDPLNFFGLIFCLMVGTASLPHVIMRFFTTPSVREARQSVGWSLLFIFILYFTAPAYAVFAKYEVFTNVLGKDISTLQAVAALPSWIFTYGKIGLLKICGANAASPEAVFAACQAVKDAAGNLAPVKTLTFNHFSILPDTVVLATPEIAGLPYVIAGLVAAGGLAAALSTADGLLLAIANALSHDIYYKMLDPKAPTARRLIVARVLLIFVALLAAYTAITLPQGILIFVSWAFSVAASGFFPALVLGVFWKRCTTAGAIAGMIAGFVVCVVYMFGTEYYGMARWFQGTWLSRQGLSNIASGVIGIPVAFLVTIVVSLMTKAPSKELQDFIDQIRVPKGGPVMGEEKPAIGH